MPFIASWASVNKKNPFQKRFPIASHGVQTQMGTVMDIYPTVLSVAGVNVPKGYVLDGSNLKTLLKGKADRSHRQEFLMHFPHAHRGSAAPPPPPPPPPPPWAGPPGGGGGGGGG